MLTEPFADALVLAGPTGSGKSSLALELAPRLGAEIVSMDSMALYRGMDIGTAKATLEERGKVPHHLIDVLDPWESANVAWWLERAGECCREIRSRGKRPLFVGGTPLYLKAMIFGLCEGPPGDPKLRGELEEQGRVLGPEVLHRRLKEVDPATAARLHPNDVRRVVRALEVHAVTGRPLGDQQVQWPGFPATATSAPPPTPPPTEEASGSTYPRILRLDLDRTELYARIDRRVESMFEAGWAAEVKRLVEDSRGLSLQAGQALGYREIAGYLRGERDLESTVLLVQQRTRQFAKRQLTWLRHLPGCVAVDAELTWKLWGTTMVS